MRDVKVVIDCATGEERLVELTEAETAKRDLDSAAAAAAAAAEEVAREIEDSLRTKAAAALKANSTFLGLASPTNAQTLAQVKVLTRENNAIIRLLLRQLDRDDA